MSGPTRAAKKASIAPAPVPVAQPTLVLTYPAAVVVTELAHGGGGAAGGGSTGPVGIVRLTSFGGSVGGCTAVAVVVLTDDGTVEVGAVLEVVGSSAIRSVVGGAEVVVAGASALSTLTPADGVPAGPAAALSSTAASATAIAGRCRPMPVKRSTQPA